MRGRGGHGGSVAGDPSLIPGHGLPCVLGEINDTRLLGKRDGHLPANFTPIFLSQLKNKTLDEELVAECNGDMQCLYDSSVTGNASTGQSTKVLLRSYRRLNATLSEWHEARGGIAASGGR